MSPMDTKWLAIDRDGNITFVDWDRAELMAEQCRKISSTGIAQIDGITMCAIASVAVGVRDYVLKSTIPLTKGDKEKIK